MRPTIVSGGVFAGALGLSSFTGCYGGRNAAMEADTTDTDADEGGSGSGGDAEDPAPVGCDGAEFDPGPARLRRLTHAEYAASVRDLLGVDAAVLAAEFPADVSTGSFDNDAANQTISVLLGERYMDAAKAIAAQVVDDANKRDEVVGCDPETGESCLREFVTRFGRRAWRRPLSSSEIEAFLDLTRDDATADEKVAIVIEAALQAPSFLFRIDMGEPAVDAPGLLRLTGYEVATRLSYFVWGTTPDDALLDAADAGELDTVEGLAEHARRMLQDDRARAAMLGLAEQWFHVRGMEDQFRDPEMFPQWGPDLATSMRAELALLLDDFMWGEEDFLGIYTATHGYADAALAEIYGIPGTGEAPALTDWAGSDERGGLLTTAAFATASSRAGDTSPVTRAVWVREAVLCDPPPAPPPDVPLLEPEDGESAQDAFERHTKDPVCAGCHVALDPIGHGLERYDSIGRLRTSYPEGSPVRLEGQIFIDGEMQSFAGGKELGALVAASDSAPRCVVAHAYRYAMGREEAAVDQCSLDRLSTTFADAGHGFEAMLVDIVTSDAFRFRRAHEG